MELKPTTEWYLDIEGTKTGPYNLDQLQGLLDEFEILPHHRVTSTALAGKWVSVQEVITTYRAAHRAGFQPPPRPAEIEKTNTQLTLLPEPEANEDPVLYLFDTLQAVKDKKLPGKSGAGNPTDWEDLSRPQRNLMPPQVGFITVVSVCLGVFVWGIYKMTTKNSAPSSPSARIVESSPKAAPRTPMSPSLPTANTIAGNGLAPPPSTAAPKAVSVAKAPASPNRWGLPSTPPQARPFAGFAPPPRGAERNPIAEGNKRDEPSRDSPANHAAEERREDPPREDPNAQNNGGLIGRMANDPNAPPDNLGSTAAPPAPNGAQNPGADPNDPNAADRTPSGQNADPNNPANPFQP